MVTFRLAKLEDVEAIAAIYDKIHGQEEEGKAIIGWVRNVYPTMETARISVEKEEMFVAEDCGRIVASAKINKEQVDVYADASWEFNADEEEVMVIHTLTVDPELGGRGYAKAFIGFYEKYALEKGCRFLRMDTNVKNTRARSLYGKLGYKEVSIVPCNFNGIDGVQLVCLEKRL